MQAIELTPGLTRSAADAALAGVVTAAPMRAFLLNNLILGEAPRWRVGLEEIGAAMRDLLAWKELGRALYGAGFVFAWGGVGLCAAIGQGGDRAIVSECGDPIGGRGEPLAACR